MYPMVLIEDESMLRRGLLETTPWAEHGFAPVGDAADAVEGERLILEKRPELVITDIRLPQVSGLDLIERLNDRIVCDYIIISGYDTFDYARRAIFLGVKAYLLKPISRTDLQEAMHKLELLGGQVKEEKQPDLSAIIRSLKKEENYKTHFLVPVKGDKLLPVSVEAIQYFYISNGLVKAVDSEGKEFVFSQSLDELAEQLNPHDFFRANRQFIVSRKAVSDISLWFNGRLAINLKVPVPEKIIISKAKASELKDWF